MRLQSRPGGSLTPRRGPTVIGLVQRAEDRERTRSTEREGFIRLGRRPRTRRLHYGLALLTLIFGGLLGITGVACLAAAIVGGGSPQLWIVGVTYTAVAFFGCNWARTGLIADAAGVRVYNRFDFFEWFWEEIKEFRVVAVRHGVELTIEVHDGTAASVHGFRARSPRSVRRVRAVADALNRRLEQTCGGAADSEPSAGEADGPARTWGCSISDIVQAGKRRDVDWLLLALEGTRPGQDNRERTYIAIELRRIGDPRVVPALIAELDQEPTRSVRANMVIALGRLGDPAAAPALRAALSPSEPTNVRMWAIDGLGRLGDRECVEQLITELQSTEWAARSYSARALGQIGDQRATLPLTGLLSDSSRTVRLSTARALGRLRDARAIPALRVAKSRSFELRKGYLKRALRELEHYE